MRIENVADLIVETLSQAGVKRIFGVVGDSLNGLTEALRRRKRSTGSTCAMRRSPLSQPRARRKSPADLRLRRVLRAGQSASDQRLVRCASQPRSGAGDRRANSFRGNRRRLFSGDPSAGAVPGMQSLLRAGLRYGAAALRAGERHSRGGGTARCRRPCHSRRRRTAAGAQARHFAECRVAAGRARRSAGRSRN